MKKIIGIILVVIIIAVFFYMLKQNSGTDKNIAKNIEANPQQNTETVVENNTVGDVGIEVDEKALALEEMQMNARKAGLSKLYIIKCSSCHGKDGKGPVGPSIAGKDSEQNYAILLKYKRGEVKNTMMAGLLENTSENELKQLADEIATFE